MKKATAEAAMATRPAVIICSWAGDWNLGVNANIEGLDPSLGCVILIFPAETRGPTQRGLGSASPLLSPRF